MGILELLGKIFEYLIPLFENLRDILEDQNDIRTFLSLLESHGPILELFQQEKLTNLLIETVRERDFITYLVEKIFL